MAIQEFGVLSGFAVNPDSIERLPILKKIEVADRKVVLYLDEVCMIIVEVNLAQQIM